MLYLKPLSGERYILVGSATLVPSTMKQYLKTSSTLSVSVTLHTPSSPFVRETGDERSSLSNCTFFASGALMRKVTLPSAYSGEVT